MDLDVAVIGGGAAGLSAALVLGRARRRTLVVDAGRQSNLAAHGVGGLLGHEQIAPAELYRRGRAELAAFDHVEVRDGHADARAVDGGFEVDGRRARALLLATGMDYAVPALDGARELWGGAVFHCPFCHGWEVRDGRLGVLGGNAKAGMQAQLLRGWSDDVVLFAGGTAAELDEATRARLADLGVAIEERPVERLRREGDALRAVVLAGGAEVERDALLVQAPPSLRDDLPIRLGCALTEHGTVEADAMGQTSVPGIWAAGDLVTLMPSVPFAIAAGHRAAAGIVHALTIGQRVPSPA